MVANPSVNMGAAILMTTLAKARAAGISEDRLIHVWGGASAEEPRDYLIRDQFFESHAQNAVLKAVIDLAGGSGKAFDAIELYSCFPCVPKMARRTLGLGPDVQPTVNGGLTFFGAPLNTYMTHAACAMVRKLRGGAKTRPALRTGRIRHQASRAGAVAAGAERLSCRRTPASRPRPTTTSARCRSSSPRPSGKGSVESFTVLYGRNGDVEHGVVMLRTANNARALARVAADDRATLAHLLNMDHSPVGSIGNITTAGDGVLEWRVG